jgi:hypothetical protein
MPGNDAWPEGAFFGYDKVYNSRSRLSGPKFGWSPMPDQYALVAYERLVHGASNDRQRWQKSLTSATRRGHRCRCRRLARRATDRFDKMSGKG